MDGVIASGNSWVTCKHDLIGKYEDVYKDVYGTRSIQGFPSPHCIVVVSELNKEVQVTNTFYFFGTAVGTAMTRWTIELNCSYEFGASYQWWRIAEDSNVDLLISNHANLYYVVDKSETLSSSFFSNGIEFRCVASTPLRSNYRIVTVKGIQHLNYGDSQMFECASSSSDNLTWKIDGKVMQGRKSKQLVTFKYDHPKRVTVECEDNQGNNLARYSMLICAVDELQQRFNLFSMSAIPIVVVFLALINICIPVFQSKAKKSATNLTKNKVILNQKVSEAGYPSMKKKNAHILALKLFLLPLCSILFYLLDLVTDYMAFVSYALHGDYKWALGTLGLIILSTIITSATAIKGLKLLSHSEPGAISNLMTKIDCYITYICLCTFSTLAINLELLLNSFKIFSGQMDNKDVSMLERKRGKILIVLTKMAFCELVFKSFGQAILQAYILSQELGKSDVCLPNKGTLSWDIRVDLWPHLTSNFTSYSTQTGVETESRCICDLWVAKGLEHCYPSAFLAKNKPKFPLMNCFIADCYTSKSRWKVFFPFFQVVCSFLQISFSMTHLGAIKNLQHVASFFVPWKIVLFYLVTSLYFFISIGTSLLLCTFLTNFYRTPYFQLMTFLSILRLILPEATSFRNLLPDWFLRILTVQLPLLAHFPIYFLMYRQFKVDGGCTLAVRNTITFHMYRNQTFGRFIAGYLLTTPKVETALMVNLRNMSFFPMDINTLPVGERMPSSSKEAVFNVRNTFNIFGHFFLWTGDLILIDLLMTIGFLCYWIFVVKPHQIVPIDNESQDKPKLHMSKFRRHSF